MKIYYETGDIKHGKYGRTSEKPGHKYFERVTIGTNPDGTNKYRYFYTEEEYNNYANVKRSLNNGKNNLKYYDLIGENGFYVRTLEGDKRLSEDTENIVRAEEQEAFKEKVRVAKIAARNLLYNLKKELEKKKVEKGLSKEYLEELEYNSKKNKLPKVLLQPTNRKRKRNRHLNNGGGSTWN